MTFFTLPKSHDNHKLNVTIEAEKLTLSHSEETGYNGTHWK